MEPQETPLPEGEAPGQENRPNRRIILQAENEKTVREQLAKFSLPSDLSPVALFREEDPDLAALLERARRRSPEEYAPASGRAAELRRYFALAGLPPASAQALRDRLRAELPDSKAYVEGDEASPSGMPGALQVVDQGYLDPAPRGIGAEHARRRAGGDGSGMRFVDVEKGWNLSHEDLADANITLIIGANVDVDGSEAHGTAVLGIVAAEDNRKDITGIASGVPSVRVASTIVDATTKTVDTPTAILRAARELRFGDVLLVEVETDLDAPGFVPIESESAVFEAICLAAAGGVVVVEPAGNGGKAGGLDLDALGFDSARPDSGALLVGAATSTVPHARAKSSNFGRRVDCFAWGESVVTLGEIRPFGLNLDPGVPLRDLAWGGHLISRQLLRRPPTEPEVISNFGGTSGASAILAGVALSVQGLAQQHLRFRFSPWQLRLLLCDPRNGTPSRDPAEDRIGVMPDLEKIVHDVLNLSPTIYLRDHPGDSGEEPRERRWESPDIVVADPALRNPLEELGEESGTEQSLIGTRLTAGAMYSVFVRARNRGGRGARQVEARVYRAPVASLLSPHIWDEEIGTTTIRTVRQGDLLTVSEPLSWQAPAAPDGGETVHAAWIALAGDGREGLPERPATWEAFQELLGSGRLAGRNFHLIAHALEGGESDPSAYVRLPFLAPGAPDEDLTMHLETVARLPRQARVWLEMPPKIADLQGIWGDPPTRDPRSEVIYVPVNPSGRHYFRERRFVAGLRAELALVIYVPPELREDSYQISVRQVWESQEVGRVTWRLAPYRRLRSAPAPGSTAGLS